jgi:hypothetical protein
MDSILAHELTPNYFRRRVRGVFSMSAMVRWTTTLFLFSLVCYGPFRYFMARFGLSEFVYIPKILLFIMIPFMISYFGRVGKALIIGGTIVTLSAVWGMIDLPSPDQALFGVWVIIPLLYGLLSSRYYFNGQNAYKKIFIILFIIAFSGVVINVFMQYPWVGASFKIGGEQIEISRRWWALGISRIGGFSGASFDAAIQILFFSVWLMFVINSDAMKMLVWIASGVGITLTTTKGILGAYLILTTFFASGRIFGHRLLWRQFWVLLLLVNFILLVFLPLSTVIIHYNPTFHGYIDRFIFESFGDRLNYTWPASFGLLHHDAEWLFGRGIGGIGTPQTYFEPLNALPADNLYVYLAVDLGPLLAAVIFLAIFLKVAGAFLRAKDASLIFSILVFFMAYGMVSNIIEAPILSLFFGVVIGRLFQEG